jgi:hypothetical protein
MRITWLEFLVGCLTTFRLALMISKEEGPADAAKKTAGIRAAGLDQERFLLPMVPELLVGHGHGHIFCRHRPDHLGGFSNILARFLRRRDCDQPGVY